MVKEFFGLNIGTFGKFSVSLVEGRLMAGVSINSDKVVDIVFGAAADAIPGDFDKPFFEMLKSAAKAGLKGLESPSVKSFSQSAEYEEPVDAPTVDADEHEKLES
jgi:hypothetical protein